MLQEAAFRRSGAYTGGTLIWDMSAWRTGKQGISALEKGKDPRNFRGKQPKMSEALRRKQKIIAFSDKKNYNSDNSL